MVINTVFKLKYTVSKISKETIKLFDIKYKKP